jgi:AraC-like DNA-binding protein
MRSGKQAFNERQVMTDPNDYEIFNYSDTYLKTVDYHHHDFYEIYFLISGNVSYIIEDKRYDLEPGNLLLTNPNELHQVLIHDDKPYNRMVLWVSRSIFDKYSTETTDLTDCFKDSEDHTNLLTPSSSEQSRLMEMFEALNEAYRDESGYGRDINKYSKLIDLLIYINKLYIEREKEEPELSPNRKNKLMFSVLEYISDNIENEISLDRLSEKFYLSKYHLCREFKKYMGTTIHRYIIQKRLVRAKQMITEGYTLNYACVKSGFSDYSNFYKSFKSEYGVSPKDFFYTVNQKRKNKC